MCQKVFLVRTTLNIQGSQGSFGTNPPLILMPDVLNTVKWSTVVRKTMRAGSSPHETVDMCDTLCARQCPALRPCSSSSSSSSPHYLLLITLSRHLSADLASRLASTAAAAEEEEEEAAQEIDRVTPTDCSH